MNCSSSNVYSWIIYVYQFWGNSLRMCMQTYLIATSIQRSGCSQERQMSLICCICDILSKFAMQLLHIVITFVALQWVDDRKVVNGATYTHLHPTKWLCYDLFPDRQNVILECIWQIENTKCIHSIK